MLNVGDDRGWSTNMQIALAMVRHPYILCTMEDFLLKEPVDTVRIVRLLEYVKARRAAYLRLYPSPGPDRLCEDCPEVGEILPASPYRTSLQAALWDRAVMGSLLREGETAWAMERQGSVRSRLLSASFLSVVRAPVTGEVQKPALSYYCTAVYKGKWMRGAVAFCASEGVPIDLTRREVETAWTEIRRWILRRNGWWMEPATKIRRAILDRAKAKW